MGHKPGTGHTPRQCRKTQGNKKKQKTLTLHLLDALSPTCRVGSGRVWKRETDRDRTKERNTKICVSIFALKNAELRHHLYRLARPRARWVSAPRTSLVGSECVCPQRNSSFVITRGSDMPSAMDLPGCISRSRELTRNANSGNGTPRQNVSNHSMCIKCSKDTITAVQHPPKAHLGLPTTSWLRPSSFDKHSCPYVGQWSNPTNRGQFHHDLRSTGFTDREQ